MSTVGERLMILIRERGLQNKDVADLLEVDASQITRWLSWDKLSPSRRAKLYTLTKAPHYFNLDYIETGQGPMFFKPASSGYDDSKDILKMQLSDKERIIQLYAKLEELQSQQNESQRDEIKLLIGRISDLEKRLNQIEDEKEEHQSSKR